MWFHKCVPLRPDIPGIILFVVLYTWHVYVQSAAAAAAAALYRRCCCSSCCCSSSCAGWQALLLVRRIWFHPVVLSLHSNTIIFNVCTPWQYCRIYGLDLPMVLVHTRIYGYARSQGSRHPAAAKPPLYSLMSWRSSDTTTIVEHILTQVSHYILCWQQQIERLCAGNTFGPLVSRGQMVVHTAE